MALDMIMTLDSESEAEVVVSSDGEDKQESHINPDFQFGEAVEEFAGWDFGGESTRKDVDLDGILRRKGGLARVANEKNKENVNLGNEKDNKENGNEKDEEDEEEEEASEASDEASEDDNSDNEESDPSEDAASNESDDELAMDGFGMGVEEEEEEENEEQKEILKDTEGKNESGKKDKGGKGGKEDLSQKDVPQNNDSQNENDLQLGNMYEGLGENDSDQSDSAEAIAEFFDETKPDQQHTTFQTLQLSRPVLRGLAQLGYTKPSPIQSAAIPAALLGRDIVAGAVTGSGKTAAYMIPIIERLLYKPAKVSSTRVVVLTPTRELAIQVHDVGKKIGQFVSSLSFGMAVGGLNLRQQEQQLKTRPDVVVATPGRLIDHIRNSPSFTIDTLEVLVIDEADRMLDEGFQTELTEILSLIPKHKRQTLLFSATMNTKIQDLIRLSLQKPMRIMIDPPKTAASRLVQEFVRVRKRDEMKPALLFHTLTEVDPNQQSRTVVFVARKETAHKLRIVLGLLGLRVAELHGSLTQEQRLANVNDFRKLAVPVLICTDLAARGLDIPKIEMVINYDMPKSHEVYLHRVGRTARAGREGRSISFVGEANQDRAIVKEAIKSLGDGKALSRSVNWPTVDELHKQVVAKKELVEEVLAEEKEEKEMLRAEMELNKAQNLIAHEKEIHSRPKRTWFQTEKEKGVMDKLKNGGNKLNSKKRKVLEERKERGRGYKKTVGDRKKGQKRR